MKNLYIYKCDGVNITKEVWNDVKKTRDGKIVKKRSADYLISQGTFQYAENIEKYISHGTYEYGYSNKDNIRKIRQVTYATFDENSIDVEKIFESFVEERELLIKKYEEEIDVFKEKIKNIKIENK